MPHKTCCRCSKQLRQSNSFFATKFIWKELHINAHSDLSLRTIQGSFNVGSHPHLRHTKGEMELKVAHRGLLADTKECDIKDELEDLGFTARI